MGLALGLIYPRKQRPTRHEYMYLLQLYLFFFCYFVISCMNYILLMKTFYLVIVVY